MRIAVPAENTIGSVLFQMGVVILRQLVPGHSKVILLSNVQAHRAWLAMVAVNAHILRCKDSQNGIVFFLQRGICKCRAATLRDYTCLAEPLWPPSLFRAFAGIGIASARSRREKLCGLTAGRGQMVPTPALLLYAGKPFLPFFLGHSVKHFTG